MDARTFDPADVHSNGMKIPYQITASRIGLPRSLRGSFQTHAWACPFRTLWTVAR